jgi:hypothetical protein
MTREEAERRVAELNASSADEHWFAREGADGWEVVKLALPPGMKSGPLHQSQPQETRPAPAGAPPAFQRFFDGPGGAGGV